MGNVHFELLDIFVCLVGYFDIFVPSRSCTRSTTSSHKCTTSHMLLLLNLDYALFRVFSRLGSNQNNETCGIGSFGG
jgi:hypothetical protein